MGQKLHRVVRACAEMGPSNPILAIHDQGAGGNGNVLKELVEDGGAIISASSFELGDETISARELWTAEYQENDACLVDSAGLPQMMKISKRESAVSPLSAPLRRRTGWVILMNFADDSDDRMPVDFDTKILGVPPKVHAYKAQVTRAACRPDCKARSGNGAAAALGRKQEVAEELFTLKPSQPQL
ncbi:hypothetical protein OESDEN_16975 [Oesophagostomum dentatum]|uniref:PurM-like C-terminal domain-containing protein n=1 Tax=Oesophagostomum dentatum TaxID=61180 RepID=A0A0B1SDE2_OESDE|nr:hypothetical protein OESDEN_16975 [Oesophagostomum dentatum]